MEAQAGITSCSTLDTNQGSLVCEQQGRAKLTLGVGKVTLWSKELSRSPVLTECFSSDEKTAAQSQNTIGFLFFYPSFSKKIQRTD